MRRKSTVLTHGTPMLVTLMIVLPRTLAASPHARCQPRVVRSPAVHAPGVRSGRSCHTPPMAQRVNRYGRAGQGHAFSPRLRKPLRVLLRMSGSATRPCPTRPTASRCAPWPSCVTLGQRRTPYAWPSGLLRYPARPRTCGLSASAGGKGFAAAVTLPGTRTLLVPTRTRRYELAAHPHLQKPL